MNPGFIDYAKEATLIGTLTMAPPRRHVTLERPRFSLFFKIFFLGSFMKPPKYGHNINLWKFEQIPRLYIYCVENKIK